MSSAERVIRNLILEKCPDYEFDRYRFKPGDIVKTLDGAIVVVEYSSISYISAFPIVRSMKFRKKEVQRINYKDLPYYDKGEFVNMSYKISKKVIWKVGDIVKSEYDDTVLLISEEDKKQQFVGFVLCTENSYYLHTKIILNSPTYGYV